MKIILFGASGMLGKSISDYFSKQNCNLIQLNSTSCNIIKKNEINDIFTKFPDYPTVINCAAYTAVDNAESDQDRAYSINTLGTKNLAECCKDHSKLLIHFSTDYVFDGEKKNPYLETDTCNPANYYGLTKERGEQEIIKILSDYYIFRVQWLFGKR